MSNTSDAFLILIFAFLVFIFLEVTGNGIKLEINDKIYNIKIHKESK